LEETKITIEKLNNLKINNRILLSFDFISNQQNNNGLIIRSNNNFHQNSLFESLIMNNNLLFNNDKEFYFITLIKDKTFQIYQKNIKISNILNNSIERLKNNDFIKETDESVTKELIWQGLGPTLGEFSKWLAQMTKDLVGFNMLNHEDLTTIISAAVMTCYMIHIDCFFHNNESLMIISNNIQNTKKRLLQIFFPHLVDLIFKFYNFFKKLNLTETELSLWYPFVLLSCDFNLVKDKETLFKIKSYYSKCLFYQFYLNKRDSIFLQNLQYCFDICFELESNKEKVFNC
jgi:hypothetical protein